MLATRALQSETGVVLLAAVLLMTVLLVLGTVGLRLSQTDLLISRNLLVGTQALWLARAGSGVGKNWLETTLPGAVLPVTLGPTALADGTYTVTIRDLGSGAYRLTSVGLGPEDSQRVVEEIVRLPDFAPSGVVTSDGDGLHPDFNDESGGIGRRIPDFSVDGRNHGPDGALSAVCPGVSPFATVHAAAQNDLTNAVTMLKHEVVTRANSFCQADGSSVAGPCTPGLFGIRGPAALPRFITAPCAAANPACFLNLDLAAAALRATALPLEIHLPLPPDDRGPFAPGAVSLPFVQLLASTEHARLRTALDDIFHQVDAQPEEKVLQLSTSLTAGTHMYGTWAEPQITRIEDGANELDISGGAVVNGAGVLLVPRVVRLKNATLNWQGIVLVTGDGDLRVEDRAACGQVLGAVVVRDDAAPDRKLDLDRVQQSGGCSPFAINYSCEAVTRALMLLMWTVSWTEQLGR